MPWELSNYPPDLWSHEGSWAPALSSIGKKYIICIYGGFLKWWYPQNTPKWSFLVGKLMVVGYHHFRKHPCVCIYILISGRVFHQPLQCRVVHWLGLFSVAGKFPTYQNPHLGEVYSLLWNLDRIGTVLVRISVEGLAFCGGVLSWGRFSNASTADQQPNLLQRHTSLSKARPENSKETKTKTLNQETEIWRVLKFLVSEIMTPYIRVG